MESFVLGSVLLVGLLIFAGILILAFELWMFADVIKSLLIPITNALSGASACYYSIPSWRSIITSPTTPNAPPSLLYWLL